MWEGETIVALRDDRDSVKEGEEGGEGRGKGEKERE